MKRILLKIKGIIRVNFWKMSYSKRVENDYEPTTNIYNLVIVSEEEFYDPFDQKYKNKIEIPFSSESALDIYIATLDNLTNSDLIIQNDVCCDSGSGTPGNVIIINGYDRYEISISFNNQTIFNLPFTMASSEIQLYCNGQKLIPGQDYTNTNTEIILTNNYFSIEINDLLDLYYVPI